MNSSGIVSKPRIKREGFRVYSYSVDEWVINNKLPSAEITGSENVDIDTIFVVEYDVTKNICAQSSIVGYKSGNTYGVAFNDAYWDRYHHIIDGITYDEMVKRMAEGCKRLS